jgi:hypothetical protein
MRPKMALLVGLALGMASCGSPEAHLQDAGQDAGLWRCAAVTCSMGNACDPEDGVCKCGTVICGSTSFCDSVLHQCTGTNCTGVVCDAGEACDPTTGTCAPK